MSRFFRSGSSSSSSASEGEAEDNDHNLPQKAQLIVSEPPPDNAQPSSTERALVLSSQSDAGTTSSHRDLLVHALLEERCLRQARDELGPNTSNDRVQRLAEYRYQSLSQRLAAYGLVESGLNDSSFGPRRQMVRDGLDVLTRTRPDAQLPAADLVLSRSVQPVQSMQRLEMGLDALRLFHQPEIPRFPHVDFTDALMTLNHPSSLITSSEAFFNSSRYQREFQEVRTLGRGGYGVVYQCKHRFDGLSYAVKKVPLSTSRLQKIREQGQAEVDRLLLELTTLARLDHPNIVRYFGGWVEYATLNLNSAHGDEDATFGASEHTTRSVSLSEESASCRRVAEVPEDDFISFETSNSRTRESTASSDLASNSADTLQRLSTRDTQPTVSDDDVESISRYSLSQSAEHSTLSTFVNDDVPCLALHIQMGLYPMTLADYISRDTATSAAKHCFHIEPALRIVTALVDGILYLHSQAIVHRDLKPANVFLAQQQSQKQAWCHQCSNRDGTTASVDAVKVRIGDFGLVAALAQQDIDDITVPVGTELYRSHNAVDRLRIEALDWFALGVMAFELLWPFSTRMERYETLSALKSGLYPHDFEQQLGAGSSEVMSLIEYLLRSSHVVTADELQSMLSSMLMICHQS